MSKFLVGIDLGTTGCKTCVFDFEGNLLGLAYREYPCLYPGPSRVEQRVEDILPMLFESCKEAIDNAGIDAREIEAMGLSSQASTFGIVDSQGKLIRDLIVWQDIRGTRKEFDVMEENFTGDEFYNITGRPINAATASVSKMLWLKHNEPENWAKIAMVSTVQDFFLKQFGADGYYTDLSSASREATCDVDNNCWSKPIHDMLGLSIDQRPVLTADPGRVVGRIGAEVAEKTGLPVGCKICVGAHDSNCATFGGGLVHGGEAVMVIGTFGSCFVASNQSTRDPNKVMTVKRNHGIGNWTVEAMATTSGSSFRWYRDVLGKFETLKANETGADPYNLLTEPAENVPIGSNGVVFLPYLQGVSSKLNYKARGSFLGMSLGTTKADLSRAVLEGVCYEMYEIVLAQEAAGITVDTIRLAGGVTKSAFWCQMFADIMGKRFQLLDSNETACLGAAMYAGVGTGIYADCDDAVNKAVKMGKIYVPNAVENLDAALGTDAVNASKQEHHCVLGAGELNAGHLSAQAGSVHLIYNLANLMESGALHRAGGRLNEVNAVRYGNFADPVDLFVG